MFDIDVLVPDFLSILDAVPVTLLMAVTIFLLSTLLGGLFARMYGLSPAQLQQVFPQASVKDLRLV